jgi:hypothetical protein
MLQRVLLSRAMLKADILEDVTSLHSLSLAGETCAHCCSRTRLQLAVQEKCGRHGMLAQQTCRAGDLAVRGRTIAQGWRWMRVFGVRGG